MIKGYIIDMDGTLLDSMHIWNELGSRFLELKGITPEANLKDILAPLSINQAIKYIAETYQLKEPLDVLINEVNSLLNHIYLSEIPLKPGALEFITNCFNHHKKLCLLTANNYQATINILDKYNLTSKFDEIITCDHTTLDKRSGEAYNYAISALHLHKDECIVIEDALHAIIAAKKQGFTVWAVADQSNQDDWDEICKISDLNLKKFIRNGDMIMKKVLTIAGTDPTGGAGVQADLKTMTAHKVYGMSIITALVAQNTLGVRDIMEVKPDFLAEQFDCVFEDIYPDAIKIGMVSSPVLIEMIVNKLTSQKDCPIVVDPVMVSTSGSRLLADNALRLLKEKLIPLATIITPNIPEAQVLTNLKINTKDDMITAAKMISEWYHATF